MAPLAREIIPAKPALFSLAYIGQGNQPPTPTPITVSGPGAPAGALSIPVSALGAAIPRNTILEFTRAAGNPSVIQVVVTAHAQLGATSLSVESFHGAHGEGISHALAASDHASWDGLYPDVGSENLDLQMNPTTQNLEAVTHGSSTAVTVARRIVTGIAPSLSRSGIFWDEPNANGLYVVPPIVKDILRYQEGRGNFYGKYIIPNRLGERMVTREAWGDISGVGTPSPANGRQELTYTFNFQTFIDLSFNDDPSGS